MPVGRCHGQANRRTALKCPVWSCSQLLAQPCAFRVQVVKGAPKGPPGDVGAYFDRARQAGAREGTEEDLPGRAEQLPGRAFQGASHTLSGVQTPAARSRHRACPPGLQPRLG